MFYFDTFLGKRILKSTLLADYDCFFTTRDFVLTSADRQDLSSLSQENRMLLEQDLGGKIVTAKQIHSANISNVSSGKFFYDNTDALISKIEDSILLLNYADCVPIILYSKKNNIGAVVHAGWRGTVQQIVRKTVLQMGINPKEITAIIGPSIGKCCFETKEDVYHQLISDEDKKELYEIKNDRYYIDLKLINYYQLKETGVNNIDMCSYCTCCMSDIFFSYRKENGITARHSAVLKIKRG